METKKKRVVINDHIVVDSEICHGVPTFNGHRIMLWQLFWTLRDGGTIDEFLEGFPDLTRDHVKAAFDYVISLMQGNFAVVNTDPSDGFV